MRTWRLALAIAVGVCGSSTGWAETLRCGPFTQDMLPAPEPRENQHARERFEEIKAAVMTQPHRVLFLGDSLTERFDPGVWRAHMAPRGVLNAGVNGDRTEHLLWRLQHGNLAGPQPQAAVLLIGTNDLGHGRTPEITAAGIRGDLLELRQRLPGARMLLLGLWPREAEPMARLRREAAAVNELIANCGDDAAILYADIGGVLLEPDGRLSPRISPDRLHFGAEGYARLAPRLDELIDRLLAAR